MPRISIVIPVYNVEKYLRQALDSALTQSLTDLEIVCVNDGSTDTSGAILEEYAKRDGRIKILTQENRGLLLARKAGMLATTGDYVMSLDSDDELLPGACEKLYREIVARNVDMLQFGTRLPDDRGKPELKSVCDFLRPFLAPIPDRLEGTDAILDAVFVPGGLRAYTMWGRIFRGDLCRKVYAQVFDRRVRFEEDGYAFLLLACFSDCADSIPDECYFYHCDRGISGMNATESKVRQALSDLILVHDELTGFADAHGFAETGAFRRALGVLSLYSGEPLIPCLPMLPEADAEKALIKMSESVPLPIIFRGLLNVIDAKNAAIEKLSAHLDELYVLRETVENYEHSFCWRITKPVRAASSLLKKILRKREGK